MLALFLCGLAAFFVVQVWKTVFLHTFWPSWFKMVLALAVSGGTAWALFPGSVKSVVVYGVAGAGLAGIAHRFNRLLQVGGDWFIRDFLRGRKQ